MLAVHLQLPVATEHRERFERSLDPSIGLTAGGPMPEATEILVSGDPSPTELSGPSLRAVIVPWVGIPIEIIERLRDHPRLALHNLPYNAASTAETAVALLLAAAKGLLRHDRLFRHHIWQSNESAEPGSVLLEGGVALILGHGRVGGRVATACRALGMQVRAVCRRPRPLPHGEAHGLSELPILLPEATALIICLPHTTETDGLLGEAELARLPSRAVLVNVARGRICEERALFEALRDRRLYAAGLDVWYRYPSDAQRRDGIPCPPAHFPFHELPNVVMSPHRAGWSTETERDRYSLLADLLNSAVHGQAMPFRVDLQRGY